MGSVEEPTGARKRCPVCGVTKRVEGFHRSRLYPDGRKRECKPCRNEENRRRLAAHPLPPPPLEKKCAACGVVKPGAEFDRRRGSPDGVQNECKACRFAYYQRWYARTFPARQAHNKLAGEREKASGMKYERMRQWRRDNPEKHAAHVAVQMALRNGTLVRKPCEVCGKKAHAHHHLGYALEHRLAVTWLCSDHHHAAHGHLSHLLP